MEDDDTRESVDSPIAWERVPFVRADHLGLTVVPAFDDNRLYLLLEAP